MAIDSDYVQQMATQLAQYDIQAGQVRAQRNQKRYDTELKAVNDLKSALNKFNSATKALKGVGTNSSMLVNKATFSSEGAATATASASAVSGSYQFYVEKLASKDQIALKLTDADLNGTLSLGQNGEAFNIDMSAISSLDDLAKAINDAETNTGIKATLVRSGGDVNLVLTSEKSGDAQKIDTLSINGVAIDEADSRFTRLSTAQDALVYLGGENGVELRSDSNTFDEAIAGVSLTFNKVTGPDDELLTLDVARDDSATKDKVQSFIDAYNTLMTSIGGLTSSGGEGSTRGPLAGDAGVLAIKSRINGLLRNDSFVGSSLINFGIAATSDGKLSLDATAFDKAMAANGDAFDKLFTGKGNLVDSLDTAIKAYTSAGNGLLTSRADSINEKLGRINDDFDALQARYDSSYARYLKQYTNLMQVMTSMEQTTTMFL